MLLVGSIFSSLALAATPGVSTAAIAVAQADQVVEDDIFAGAVPLTNNELKAARGGIRVSGEQYQIGAQISRQAMQSSLNRGVGPR